MDAAENAIKKTSLIKDAKVTNCLLYTSWPSNIGLAATFDTEHMYNFAKASSAEYRALGIVTALGPQIDLATEPRWLRAVSYTHLILLRYLKPHLQIDEQLKRHPIKNLYLKPYNLILLIFTVSL